MRETLKKVASLGHQLLCPKSTFTGSRLLQARSESPGKSYLSLVCAKIMQGSSLIENDHQSVPQILQTLRQRLDTISHPTKRSAWNFFMNEPDDSRQLEHFWESLSADEFRSVWESPDALGWLYQYFLEPGLDNFRSPSGPKVGKTSLAPRTQQFTPRWIAEFLVQNTLGRLWIQMHPDSRLIDQMPYLVPLPDCLSPLPIKPAKAIKIIDPACGTMHLGLAAMEVLKKKYNEEYKNAGRRGWPEIPSVDHPDQIAESMIVNNLYGIDIDPLALELSAMVLHIYSNGKITRFPNLLCVDSLKISSLARFSPEGFPNGFDVILLNPPYMDKRVYHPKLKSFMARTFKQSGRNLYTAFLERSLDFLAPGGRLGAVTPQTFMFISSFESLRRILLDHTVIETLTHTGLNTFDDAVVDCAFYVLRREDTAEARKNHQGRFIRLTALTCAEEKHSQLLQVISELSKGVKSPADSYIYRQSDFSALPAGPWVYWIGPNIRRLFSELPSLGNKAELRQGLATTHNDRFLRYWWEIPRESIAFDCRTLADAAQSGKKWFPYMKGGGFRKWYGMQKYLVNWEQDGREIKAEIARRYPYLNGNWHWVAKNTEFYFREGVTYSYLTSGQFSARYLPPGFIFDVAGSSVFHEDPYLILAVLNSRWCRFALGLINSTVNFQVGDLQRLPIPDKPCPQSLRDLVMEAIELSKFVEAFDETSPDFHMPPPWPEGCELVEQKNRRLIEIHRQIDLEVYQFYDLGPADRNLVEQQTSPNEIPPRLTSENLAALWISYAVGVAFGRYPQRFFPTNDFDLIHSIVPEDDQGLAGHVRTILTHFHGRQSAERIIALAPLSGRVPEYLSGSFFARHFKLFQHRPIYWFFKRRGKLSALYYHNLNEERFCRLISEWNIRRTVEPFHFDNGIAANIRPFRKYLALNSWKRYLR